MINLKDNIWIEGFSTKQESDRIFEEITSEYPVIYIGKTYEIPEEIAKEYVESGFYQWPFYCDVYYFSGKEFKTAKESIQSACPEPYCIIFKK